MLSNEQITDVIAGYIEDDPDIMCDSAMIVSFLPSHLMEAFRAIERAAREAAIEELTDIANDDPSRPLIDAIRALREN